MKKCTVVIVAAALWMVLLHVCPSNAAELLDVKPVIEDGAPAVEVTADIPMTYTYYKVPGQARAVVDIADADPEKVEPLIVVNKGAVSSISVDKAQISGMVVSRLIFNLVSEADIAVKAAADRKKLLVSFSGAKPVAPAPKPALEPDEPHVKPAAPVVEPAAPIKPAEKAAPVAPGAAKDDDPLGLDEPAPVSAAAHKASSRGEDALQAAAVAAATAPARAPATTKLVPVVPEPTLQNSRVVIKKIVIGKNNIELRASGRIENFKSLKLSKPERLVLDIPGARSNLAAKAQAIKKFGVSKLRVGMYPGYVRVVLESAGKVFPAYEASASETGLVIKFK